MVPDDSSKRRKIDKGIVRMGVFESAKIRAALVFADSHHIDSPVIIIMPYSSPVLIMDSFLPIGRLFCICRLLVHSFLFFLITKVI